MGVGAPAGERVVCVRGGALHAGAERVRAGDGAAEPVVGEGAENAVAVDAAGQPAEGVVLRLDAAIDPASIFVDIGSQAAAIVGIAARHALPEGVALLPGGGALAERVVGVARGAGERRIVGRGDALPDRPA